MLRRIAESLFWIGRYVERADDTARILDVHVHDVVDTADRDDAGRRMLLDVMGIASEGELDTRRLTELLALDESNPSSIVSSLRSARENARGARESISAEMWESLNATWHALALQVRAVELSGPHALFRFVPERSALFFGLADSTMSRDDAWSFLVLGRSLERVDMTARLLSSRVGQPAVAHDWVTLLTSCSAYEAFLRSVRREVTPGLAVEFLLLDRLFPRSVLHAMLIAESCLADLDRSSAPEGRVHEARRILGQARASLEYEPAERLLADLGEWLQALQAACSAAGGALAEQWFGRVSASPWQREGALAAFAKGSNK
ncbi:MAG: alpha-E domain-containing protein [Acidobacteria bacterium]|nr:alpha-E domain-containing protein [Acidobacteriota bacterium]